MVFCAVWGIIETLNTDLSTYETVKLIPSIVIEPFKTIYLKISLVVLIVTQVELSSFINERISPIKRDIIDNYISKTIDNIKKELTIHSDYTIEKNNSFIVDLKALEDEILLIDLKISVPTKKQASNLCARWKENPSDIYTKIVQVLFNEEN